MPFGLGFGELVMVLLVLVVPFIAVWRIVAKAGYAGAWAFLLFVPLVNVIALFVFAFSNWPLERRAGGRAS
ncbi:hypothetical protein [Longimicrobium sp.]|uniref:hypothetical protein n=1 Tax=Longimicrobium sp. TaxID=2029185 RepID=UPI002E349999|nr:hypothetical protein [Longimicrobium sp.]HEX6039404.1 hypothetical protein [Longimicrobium sp.]